MLTSFLQRARRDNPFSAFLFFNMSLVKGQQEPRTYNERSRQSDLNAESAESAESAEGAEGFLRFSAPSAISAF